MIPQQPLGPRLELAPRLDRHLDLDRVQHQIYEYGVDPEFQLYCIDNDVDPFEADRPQYWSVFSDYVTDCMQKERATEGNSLERMALELAAQMPAALYSYRALEGVDVDERQEAREQLERVSYFNGTLRTLAALYPSVKASEVRQMLHNTAAISIARPSLIHEANDFIRKTVRGARHELAFEKILKHTGRAYRETDVEEDLAGADFVVEGNIASKPHRIDIKASTHELRLANARQGKQKAYKVMPDGAIVMYSLVRDTEIGDSFTVSDEVAAERAQGLEEILREIESAKRVPRIPLQGVRVG